MLDLSLKGHWWETLIQPMLIFYNLFIGMRSQAPRPIVERTTSVRKETHQTGELNLPVKAKTDGEVIAQVTTVPTSQSEEQSMAAEKNTITFEKIVRFNVKPILGNMMINPFNVKMMINPFEVKMMIIPFQRSTVAQG